LGVLILCNGNIVWQLFIAANAFQIFEFGRVIGGDLIDVPVIAGDTDYLEAVGAKILLPLDQVGKRIKTRPAPRCPKIEYDDLALHFGERSRFARKPLIDRRQFGSRLAEYFVVLLTFLQPSEHIFL
jgi:hypothetical protein